MGKKYIIEFDRENCIGAAACVAVQPDQWEIVNDGKADFKGSKEKNKKFTKEIDESEFAKFKEAAESCPVNVIHIIEKDTKKKII